MYSNTTYDTVIAKKVSMAGCHKYSDLINDTAYRLGSPDFKVNLNYILDIKKEGDIYYSKLNSTLLN